MTLSIIIVNWNVKDLLEKCLASVYKETRNIRFEVIVIDNASGDGSAEMIRKKFPQVNLIENKENRWFAGGNNQGFKISKGELILLLNPDTEILDGAINKMVGIMKGGIKNQELRIKNRGKNEENKLEIGNWKLEIGKKIPFSAKTADKNPPSKKREISNLGVLGCKLLNSDMTLQPSCRRLPHLLDQILILLKLHNFFPRLKPVRDYYMVDYLHNDTRKVEQVMGACLMTRKEIIDNIGGLDENYGSIFEEVDFCKRVLDNGWKIYFTPEARIVHHKGQSFRQRKIITNQKNFNRALLRYFRKYESFWQYLIILLLWPVSMFLAVVDQMMNLAGIRGFKAKFKNKNY